MPEFKKRNQNLKILFTPCQIKTPVLLFNMKLKEDFRLR